MRSRILIASLLAFFVAGARAQAEPLRVATLLPYVEDALRDLPSAKPTVQIVATVRRTVDQPPAGAVDLGTSHTPNFERIAASGAELVIGDERMHAALRPKLHATGAEVLMLRADSVQATLDGLLAVGRRVGAEREMAARIARTRADLASLKLGRPVETLVLFGAPGSFLLATPKTWLGDLIAELGFSNPVNPTLGGQSFPGYVQVNDEVLASLRPDLVLLVTHGDPAEMEQAFRRATREREAWRGLGEARLGVHVLPPRIFSANPGLRLGEAARHLVQLAGGR